MLLFDYNVCKHLRGDFCYSNRINLFVHYNICNGVGIGGILKELCIKY